MSVAENNKRIIKNTAVLYARMLVMMVLGLFTSRVTINALGVEDYGLNNVVAGFVSMLVFFNGILAQGSSRFITFHLGTGDIKRLKEVFSACMTLHVLMSLLVLIGAETIGLWFVNHKLNIDPTRMVAANYVYQFAVISTCLSVTQVPYSSAIVAHEKMSAFAWMVILDVVAKLFLVVLLLHVEADKLILYSIFMCIVSFVNLLIARIYCHIKFEECTIRLSYDNNLYAEMFNYTGWNTIGAFAFMAHDQGLNILLNMFYGTVVNASRGIAFTVSSYVSSFMNNFQTAASPQIIKYHASGDDNQMNTLIHNTSKYSTFLLIIVGIPVFIEAESLIRIWLGHVPEYVVWFVRLTLIQSLVQSIDIPVGKGIHAFGKMKLPNIVSGSVYMMILPISYIAMRMGAAPIIAYVVIILTYPIALLTDLWILQKYSAFHIGHFLKDVVIRILIFTTTSSVVPVIIHCQMNETIGRVILVTLSSCLISSAVIYRFGLEPEIRRKLILFIKRKLNISKQ